MNPPMNLIDIIAIGVVLGGIGLAVLYAVVCVVGWMLGVALDSSWRD